MATTTNYTAQDWAEHEQFVQMFRAAKQRKREWQQKMEVVLAEKAEKIRKRREEIDKLFEKQEMNKLDTERINEYAPYKVEMEGGQYIFETDHNM